MKATTAMLCMLAMLATAPARGESLDQSPLIGTWAVDVSRLPIPADARPKSVSITFSPVDEAHLATVVEVIDASGAKMHAEGMASLDGTPAPVTGNLEADVSAATMPAPHVLVIQLARGGIPASTRVYVVSDDGASMVETAAYVGADGNPVLRTNYFSRAD